ncbi:MAG: hypothetical protein HKN59_07615 [Gammaproteobacteria bacterium]|nr:hypothetical protein [Gammaproteobacteria bacterium]
MFSFRVTARLTLLTGVALTAAGLAMPAFAVTVTPAIDNDDLAEIAETVRAPKTEDPVHVLCETTIESSGRTQYVMCVSRPEGMKEHEQAAIRALKKVRLTPAEVNGKRVRVATPISVVFIPGDDTRVIAVPNDGRQAEKYGFDYTSPQRLGDVNWNCISQGSRRLARSGKDCNSTRTKFLMDFHVDEYGQVSECEIHRVAPLARLSGDVCAQVDRFIPGIVNGEPRPMRYIEPLWSGS